MTNYATVGNVEIRAVSDVVPPPMAPIELFPDVPANAWEVYRAQHLTPEGNLPMHMGHFLLRSEGRIILVDTGLGPGPHQNFGGGTGKLLEQMEDVGVPREAVDVVIITHLHPDHIGWNITTEGGRTRPTFPKAQYLIPRIDWEHFTHPAVLPDHPVVQACAVPLQGLGVMELVGDGHAVTAEITVLHAPGHTPGHLCVLINSHGQQGIVVGDLVHSSVQFTEADWCSRADMDKSAARRSRHALLDRLEQEGFVVAAGHLAANANIGRVVRLQGCRQWRGL